MTESYLSHSPHLIIISGWGHTSFGGKLSSVLQEVGCSMFFYIQFFLTCNEMHIWYGKCPISKLYFKVIWAPGHCLTGRSACMEKPRLCQKLCRGYFYDNINYTYFCVCLSKSYPDVWQNGSGDNALCCWEEKRRMSRRFRGWLIFIEISCSHTKHKGL